MIFSTESVNTSYENSYEYPRKHFKHVISENVEISIKRLCRIIGQYGKDISSASCITVS